MSLERFHPAVQQWFRSRFPAGPSIPQVEGWPAIASGRHTLIAAPTGSGKTLAAFLAAIDELVRRGLADAGGPGALRDEVQVVYVSPLKALSNDIRKNLDEPLLGIRRELVRMGLPDVEIRTAVRTGDTPSGERQAMLRRPPHILVTTPESLFILLTTERGRAALQTVRTVIVDEIHAVADDKRGSHLALTLERLEHLTLNGTVGDAHKEVSEGNGDGAKGHGGGNGPHVVAPLELFPEDPAEAPGVRPAGRAPVRIGLSATQQPIEDVARFLVGTHRGDPLDCVVIDQGHVRDLELSIEIPPGPLSAMVSSEDWEKIYDRLAELIEAHRTTLVFVNTRRLAERVVHHLSKRVGEDRITSHHGSLSRERRLDAEQRLKAGELRALVATASLELGIDIGTVDMVCQIGSPHTIAALLQRVGRSGRLMGATAKGRLFALSRDELIECAGLQLAAREGLLDRLIIPVCPLDILAQHLVAASATREWGEDELFDLVRGAYPFRSLTREAFDQVLHMLADGYATQRGRRAAYLHHDEINGRIRGRRGARLAAVTSGGAIPDTSDYQVVLDPEGIIIGSINEDFAIESLVGDIFQLGNASWQVLKVETGRVRVADAHGQPPSMPFWLGEAPARTPELSALVSRVRAEVARRLLEGPGVATRWLVETVGLEFDAAVQIEEYLEATRRVLTVVPTQETLVLERFFDEAGGMQLIVHAPFGGRINRAWGLALRKRFCRSFNFELQAAANEDAIVLSLGPQHSFPLIDVFRYLTRATARELLVQALLAAPMFQTRWRWNASRSLAILRQQGGQRVAPQLLRMRAEDLLAAAFPQAAACLEHVVGDIEVPDHPIVRQTVEDCLTEAMDIDGLEALLSRIERGELTLIARDVPEPSPLAHEILNARPYAFLDDAPAEERRTLAVSTRRNNDFRANDDLGTLDAAAIGRVRAQAWPDPESADEVHEALAWLGVVTAEEAVPWATWLAALADDRRAARVTVEAGGRAFWIAAERLPEIEAVYGAMTAGTPIEAPPRARARTWDPQEALTSLLRGRTEGMGPLIAAELADTLGLPVAPMDAALIELETEGVVLRGHFTPGSGDGAQPAEGVEPGVADPSLEWCHRRLLSRIHRYTIERLRAEIEPAAPADFLRFLFHWQHLDARTRLDGPQGVAEVMRQLQAFEAPAVAWERDILPSRVRDYDPAWLDQLCLSGALTWGRLVAPAPGGQTNGDGRPRSGPVRSTPLAFLLRDELAEWQILATAPALGGVTLSDPARQVLDALRSGGASFAQDLAARTGLLPSLVERGLAELVSWGVVTADGVSGLRALLLPEFKRHARRHPRRDRVRGSGAVAGRWAIWRPESAGNGSPAPTAALAADTRRDEAIECLARQLLARYGVIVRRLTDREAPLAPWRDVLRVLRRLEMRGEIRGGRFLQGAAGEHFALPEAVEALRAIRRRLPDGALITVSGGDPLNLAGIVTPGDRIAALAGNRVVYRDGIPIAVKEGRAVRFLREPESPAERREVEALLIRRAAVGAPTLQ
ncbi:MAG: DEAD/DEAH box helicase [Gemmatimonadota bacterium]